MQTEMPRGEVTGSGSPSWGVAEVPWSGVWSLEPGMTASALGPLLPLQTYTAVYYVLADVVMLSLYFHYKFKKRPSPCKCNDSLCVGRLRGQRGGLGAWEEAGARWLVVNRTAERLPPALSEGLNPDPLISLDRGQ